MSEATRRAAIDALLAERLGASTPIQHSDSNVSPLTHVQQSLWLTSHLVAEDPNLRPLSVRLSGDLDPVALDAAIEAVVRRHPILCSIFPLQGSEPVQISGQASPQTITQDVSADVDPEAASRDLMLQHTSRTFDLETEVPFVPLLIRISPTEHVLSLAMHHIVFDGWSERLFLNELIVHYDAAVDGSEVAGLADLTIDYADHSRWERARASEDSFKTQLEYWRKQLADLPPDLQLPRDRQVPQDAVASRVHVQIPSAVMVRLDDLAKRHEATAFMVFLAALQVLIARHCAVDDMVIGVPTPGRSRSETEHLIGCFINMVPIRSTLAGNPTFSQVLGQTRQTTLEALDNSSVPYGQVFGSVRPWSPDRTPLHRVQFQMRDFHEVVRTSSHVQVDVLEMPPGANNQLVVRAERTSSGATITFGFDPTMFHRETIERWSGHYVNLLESVANDDPAIYDIALIGEAERAVLEGFNPPESAYLPSPPLLADVLRSVAAEFPEVIALEDGDRRVTYAEFDAMVDSIAWSLASRGLGPEDKVVLHADRGIEAAAVIFGTMRAGVAYIPMDSELTSEWLETVIEQAQPNLILVTGTPSARSDGIEVRDISELLDGGSQGPFESQAKPEDLAYLLYTSGSTGPPKGVMIEQGNVAWYQQQNLGFEPLNPGDRVIWFHSLSFDAHMNSLHAGLSTGATVVMRDESSIYSIPRMLKWLADRRITHLRTSVGFFHVMVEEMIAANLQPPDTLELIAFGGEQVRADLVNTWLKMTGCKIRTIDSYGPTEVTVWVSGNDVADPPGQVHEWVSIGPPSAPSRAYILDEHQNPTPIGIFGELYLSGPLVARGYLNAPELTAQRFVPDPYAQIAGTRMYRSGDISRYLPDGTLEVVGRVDRQVKIRGFRVEPAEVEAALRAVPGIEVAVVVAAANGAGDMELHGFVMIAGGQSVDLHEVRQSLAVPKFMLPNTLVEVSDIPKTIGGKIDQNALLRDASRPSVVAPPAAGGADIVERIWCEVLGLDAVNQDDDFFALGGHSLLAIKVVSRVEAQLGVALELTDLFEHPTLGAFSALAVETGSDDDLPAAPSAAAAATPPPAPPPGADMDDFLTALEQMSDEEAEEMLRRLDAGEL